MLHVVLQEVTTEQNVDNQNRKYLRGIQTVFYW